MTASIFGSPLFRGPDLKLHRAETHITDLHVLMKRFMDAQSYKVFADLNLHPGCISWVARGKEVFSHDEFAPVIGDAIHNLRGALDLAVSAIVRLSGGADKNVEFLTRDTRDEFEKAIENRAEKQSWPKNLVDILKSRVQPYIGGEGYMLRILHKLAIMDKHRLLIPIVFGTSVVYLGVNGIHVPIHVGGPVPIKDGAVVAKIPTADLPSVNVGQEALISLSIAFDEGCDRLTGAQVVDGVIGLRNATNKAIDAMRECMT